MCVAVVTSPAGEHLSPQLIDRHDGCVCVCGGVYAPVMTSRVCDDVTVSCVCV